MNLLKRTTIILTAFLLLVFPLASCSQNELESGETTISGAVSDSDKSPEFTEDGVELLEEPIVISDALDSYYDIIRPDEATTVMISCLRKIADFPKTADKNTRVSLSLGTDWVKRGTDPTPLKEVLIGYTSREETKAVMSEIGYDDFAIVVKGNKIVIAAHKEERLVEATNFFCDKLLRLETDENGNQSVKFIGTYHYKSGKDFVLSEENPLSSYKIVCDTSSKSVLESVSQLQKAISAACGVTLEIVDDSTKESECEIVVGNVKRDICDQYISQNSELTLTDLVIATQEKQILIGMKNDTMIPIAISTFCSTYASKYYSNTLNFEKDKCIVTLAYKFNDTTELAEGSDIRIMSFNVLCELWNDKLPIAGRDATMMAVLLAYSPEVVGLQEISDKYYESLNRLFGEQYAIVDAKNGKGETNFSPLAYNTEKVTLKDHGVKVFSKGNSTKLRLASWAVFESKLNGKTFAVVNTHWDLGGNAEYRTVHATEMAGVVNDLKAKYNCPVITTGDYNTRDSESQYSTYVSLASLSSAKHTAKKVDHAYASTHGVGKMVSTSTKESIDHIFGTSDVEFLYYNMLIDQVVLDSSDHCPIYADIKLK